jgi:hypothetical protein
MQIPGKLNVSLVGASAIPIQGQVMSQWLGGHKSSPKRGGLGISLVVSQISPGGRCVSGATGDRTMCFIRHSWFHVFHSPFVVHGSGIPYLRSVPADDVSQVPRAGASAISSGFCNFTKASEASKKTLNSSYSFLRRLPFRRPLLGFFCATFSVLFSLLLAFF